MKFIAIILSMFYLGGCGSSKDKGQSKPVMATVIPTQSGTSTGSTTSTVSTAELQASAVQTQVTQNSSTDQNLSDSATIACNCIAPPSSPVSQPIANPTNLSGLWSVVNNPANPRFQLGQPSCNVINLLVNEGGAFASGVLRRVSPTRFEGDYSQTGWGCTAYIHAVYDVVNPNLIYANVSISDPNRCGYPATHSYNLFR